MATTGYALSTLSLDEDRREECTQVLTTGRTAKWFLGRVLVVGAAALLGLIVVAACWTAGPLQKSLRQGSGRTLLIHQEADGEVRLQAEPEHCLCVFDIDRTLTGKQQWAHRCLEDKKMHGVRDTAYKRGTLLLSDLGQHIDETFCCTCNKAIITVGTGSGPKEREVLLEILGGEKATMSTSWQDIGHHQHGYEAQTVNSSLVVNEGYDAPMIVADLKSMVEWWRTEKKIEFKPENVYYFDDRKCNIEVFIGSGFNAKQISCASRGPKEWHTMSHPIGGCGGTMAEVVPTKGVTLCE